MEVVIDKDWSRKMRNIFDKKSLLPNLLVCFGQSSKRVKTFRSVQVYYWLLSSRYTPLQLCLFPIWKPPRLPPNNQYLLSAKFRLHLWKVAKVAPSTLALFIELYDNRFAQKQNGIFTFRNNAFLTAFDFSILHHHHHKIFASDSKTHLQHRRFKMQLRHTPNGTIYMLLLRRYQVVWLSTRKSLFWAKLLCK